MVKEVIYILVICNLGKLNLFIAFGNAIWSNLISLPPMVMQSVQT